MIGKAQGDPISITGLGAHAPDRVLTNDELSTIVDTTDEWYLQGHFPGRPIMPGVLIVEALAQTGAVAVLSEEENRGKLAFFAGIDDCRFKRIVEPGDVLELRCELERVRGPIGRGKAEARVDGELACKATLTFAVERSS